MTLLNPIWLWALGGLILPLAIHLLSRKEGKTIRIGSIRFLSETSTSRFSSLRLNEVALLAVRCLLIVLIALLLASLLISKADSPASQQWVAVEKGLENNEPVKNLLDSLQKDNFEIRRLLPGFPIPDADTATQPPDYFRLSEELSQKNNIHALVIASNSLSGFKGKRISLPENITWLSYPVTLAQDLSTDSLMLADTIRITLAFDKAFQYDKKIMRAALKALPAKITIEETEIKNLKKISTPWIIWLSEDIITHTGKSLRFSEDAVSDLIVQESKNTWILTKRLNEENAVERHLPIQLMAMLFHEKVKHKIHQLDKRTVPDELAWSKNNNVQAAGTVDASRPADKILILLIALVFIAERILAFYRKQ